ncbi:hypothetical protein [Escherichia coli]|uniref:hypothetical protein n=1 Tax=Escherichia coli TaxID=562 RepID=UPI00117B653B|nr:hypothetical protein [Escherichia coli]
MDNIHHRFGLIVSNLEEKFHDFMGVILMVLGDESNTFGLIVSNLEEKFHDFMGVILMVLGDESNTSRRFCRIIQKYRGKSKQER